MLRAVDIRGAMITYGNEIEISIVVHVCQFVLGVTPFFCWSLKPGGFLDKDDSPLS